MQMKFLPALFGNESLMDSQRQLTCLPIKKSGLVIANPMELAGGNCKASTVACGHLISALQGKEEFQSVMHQSIMVEEKAATCKMNL
jgi:hypothetical protein